MEPMNMRIVPIEEQHIPHAKELILKTVVELQIVPSSSTQELEEKNPREFEDLMQIPSMYLNNRGMFLVMLNDENEVVGMGAIRYWNDDICELRRMYFSKEYRGQGLGKQIAQKLFEYARIYGYKKVRLDVYNPTNQQAAVSLYKKLGFYEIEPYRKSPAKIFMEKIL